VLVGAAVGAAAAGILLLPAVAPGPLILGTALLLTFPVFSPAGRRGDEADETVLHEAQTPFGSLRVTEIVYPGKRQPERRLYQNDEVESGELVRSGAPTFAYITAAEWLLAELGGGRREAYLFLGGGAYTLPRRVAERDPTARITVVELDPEVTRAAYRFFGVRAEHRVESIHGDARQVAAHLAAGEWDRVFVDVYDGTETVPYPLVTLEAMREYARLLRPGGVVVVNVIGVADGEGDRRFWSTVRTAREAFASLRLYYHLSRDFPDRQNFLLAGSADPDARLPAAAGTFEPWPEPEWPRHPDTIVFRDRFPASDERRAALPAGDAAARPARPPTRARPGQAGESGRPAGGQSG
jgi:SAM-dependent methyltransferase